MNEKKETKMHKTFKALDWACSCLIRLPVMVMFSAGALIVLAMIMLILSPENIERACKILGIGI